jgi:hypothetical protein
MEFNHLLELTNAAGIYGPRFPYRSMWAIKRPLFIQYQKSPNCHLRFSVLLYVCLSCLWSCIFIWTLSALPGPYSSVISALLVSLDYVLFPGSSSTVSVSNTVSLWNFQLCLIFWNNSTFHPPSPPSPPFASYHFYLGREY